jgi:cell wall-associated NlpC family hydrolase
MKEDLSAEALAKEEAGSYFDEPLAARKLRQEALSWVGTPFREYYQEEIEAHRTKNPGRAFDLKGGGIDCIGLVQEIYARTGAAEHFIFKREAADYQSHQLGEKILDWLRGKVDDPQSKRLSELFIELEIPDAVKDPFVETPRDFFKPGDILVMQHGSLFHMPVLYDDELHFVNALPRLGVTEGTIQDSTYSKHLVAAFRLKPKQDTSPAKPW